LIIGVKPVASNFIDLTIQMDKVHVPFATPVVFIRMYNTFWR